MRRWVLLLNICSLSLLGAQQGRRPLQVLRERVKRVFSRPMTARDFLVAEPRRSERKAVLSERLRIVRRVTNR